MNATRMNAGIALAVAVMVTIPSLDATASGDESSDRDREPETHLYMDVHRLGPDAVTAADVAAAHAKDLEVQASFGVNFVAYWVDEAAGVVWCLSEAPDGQSIRDAHAAAHGLVPDETFQVIEGE